MFKNIDESENEEIEGYCYENSDNSSDFIKIDSDGYLEMYSTYTPDRKFRVAIEDVKKLWRAIEAATTLYKELTK